VPPDYGANTQPLLGRRLSHRLVSTNQLELSVSPSKSARNSETETGAGAATEAGPRPFAPPHSYHRLFSRASSKTPFPRRHRTSHHRTEAGSSPPEGCFFCNQKKVEEARCRRVRWYLRLPTGEGIVISKRRQRSNTQNPRHSPLATRHSPLATRRNSITTR